MNKAVKKYIDKIKEQSEVNLHLTEDFKKLHKVIRSCVTIEQLSNAKKMSALYIKKWENSLDATVIIDVLIKDQAKQI